MRNTPMMTRMIYTFLQSIYVLHINYIVLNWTHIQVQTSLQSSELENQRTWTSLWRSILTLENSSENLFKIFSPLPHDLLRVIYCHSKINVVQSNRLYNRGRLKRFVFPKELFRLLYRKRGCSWYEFMSSIIPTTITRTPSQLTRISLSL